MRRAVTAGILFALGAPVGAQTPPRGRVFVRSVSVEPSADLDPGRAHAALRSREGDLERCYRAALARRGDLAGPLVLAFSVDPQGAVTEVTLREGPAFSHAEGECIAAALRASPPDLRPSEPARLTALFELRPVR